MRIQSAEAYRYKLPFRGDQTDRALAPSAYRMKSPREGFLIRLSGEDGSHAWGEVGPLPGRSPETLESLQAGLVERLTSLVGERLPVDWDELRLLGLSDNLPSSARFGIEQAVAGLAAHQQHSSLARWIRNASRPQVRVNALLAGSVEDVLRTAEERLREGYGAFKLKVGLTDIDGDVRLVRRLREIVGHEAELRLDANRAWQFEDAVRFLGEIRDLRIAYIEEPLEDAAGLRELALQTNVPIAIDESIRDMMEHGSQPTAFSFATAAVLKPSLVGGMLATMDLAEGFYSCGVEPVVTSLFESQIGLDGVAAVASAVVGAGWAAGLDTLRYFSSTVLTGESFKGGPVYTPGESLQAFSVQIDRLSRVT